jgi:2-polyprenyl-3-methyl-5-hydroxy-6-metoxy-1,4-benzoquinol methylase
MFEWGNIKLGIGLCNDQDVVKSKFFWNYQTLLKPPKNVAIRGESRLKAASLNRIVEEAWRWKIDKLLLMDIDQMFPVDTIPKLLSRNLPIVSGLTHLREHPYSPAAGWIKDEKAVNDKGQMWKDHFSPFPDNKEHLVEVDWVGVSCLLIDMEVFNRIYFPCFKEIWDDKVGDRIKGHDLVFCEAAKKAGYRIFVDTLVKPTHLGEQDIDDVFVKAFYRSKITEVEKEILQEATQDAAYWDDQYFSEKMKGIKRTYSKEWELILSYIEPGNKVAELGCGMGHLMEGIKKMGADPYGYDFSSVAIDNLTQRGLKGEVADLRDFKPNGEAYDVVVGSHVLEHMEFPLALVQLCAKLLKDPSGKVILSVPSEDIHPISKMEHQHDFTAESLETLMGNAFEQVTIEPITIEKFGKSVKPALVAIGSQPYGI